MTAQCRARRSELGLAAASCSTRMARALAADAFQDDLSDAFSASEFVNSVVWFGIPLVVALVVTAVTLRVASWRAALLVAAGHRCGRHTTRGCRRTKRGFKSLCARARCGRDSPTHNHTHDTQDDDDGATAGVVPVQPWVVWWATQLFRLLLLAPCGVCVAWGIHAAHDLRPKLVGAGIALLWTALLCWAAAMALWRGQAWRLGSHVSTRRRAWWCSARVTAAQCGLVAGFGLFVAFEVVAMLTYKTFTGMSWVFLGFNMVPMVFIACVVCGGALVLFGVCWWVDVRLYGLVPVPSQFLERNLWCREPDIGGTFSLHLAEDVMGHSPSVLQHSDDVSPPPGFRQGQHRLTRAPSSHQTCQQRTPYHSRVRMSLTCVLCAAPRVMVI